MKASRVIACLTTIVALLAGALPSAGDATLDCLIYPEVVVAVSASVDGLLEKVHVDRGDLVRTGHVLATLESSVEKASVELARARAELEAALQSSQVRVDFGLRRFVRTEDLYKKNLVPLREMDEAETTKILAEIGLVEAHENRRMSQLDLARARAALALRTIRSPVTGVVIERSLATGEFAKQAPIVRIAQIDPLRVEVIVPVSLLNKITVGMRADVLPEVGGSHTARVTVVDRVVDAASGTFGVRLALPNADYRLPAGLKCKVRFPTR